MVFEVSDQEEGSDSEDIERRRQKKKKDEEADTSKTDGKEESIGDSLKRVFKIGKSTDEDSKESDSKDSEKKLSLGESFRKTFHIGGDGEKDVAHAEKDLKVESTNVDIVYSDKVASLGETAKMVFEVSDQEEGSDSEDIERRRQKQKKRDEEADTSETDGKAESIGDSLKRVFKIGKSTDEDSKESDSKDSEKKLSFGESIRKTFHIGGDKEKDVEQDGEDLKVESTNVDIVYSGKVASLGETAKMVFEVSDQEEGSDPEEIERRRQKKKKRNEQADTSKADGKEESIGDSLKRVFKIGKSADEHSKESDSIDSKQRLSFGESFKKTFNIGGDGDISKKDKDKVSELSKDRSLSTDSDKQFSNGETFRKTFNTSGEEGEDIDMNKNYSKGEVDKAKIDTSSKISESNYFKPGRDTSLGETARKVFEMSDQEDDPKLSAKTRRTKKISNKMVNKVEAGQRQVDISSTKADETPVVQKTSETLNQTMRTNFLEDRKDENDKQVKKQETKMKDATSEKQSKAASKAGKRSFHLLSPFKMEAKAKDDSEKRNEKTDLLQKSPGLTEEEIETLSKQEIIKISAFKETLYMSDDEEVLLGRKETSVIEEVIVPNAQAKNFAGINNNDTVTSYSVEKVKLPKPVQQFSDNSDEEFHDCKSDDVTDEDDYLSPAGYSRDSDPDYIIPQQLRGVSAEINESSLCQSINGSLNRKDVVSGPRRKSEKTSVSFQVDAFNENSVTETENGQELLADHTKTSELEVKKDMEISLESYRAEVFLDVVTSPTVSESGNMSIETMKPMNEIYINQEAVTNETDSHSIQFLVENLSQNSEQISSNEEIIVQHTDVVLMSQEMSTFNEVYLGDHTESDEPQIDWESLLNDQLLASGDISHAAIVDLHDHENIRAANFQPSIRGLYCY